MGGSGNDVFVGISGSDTIVGGSGFDTLDFSLANAALNINLATPQFIFGQFRVHGRRGGAGLGFEFRRRTLRRLGRECSERRMGERCLPFERRCRYPSVAAAAKTRSSISRKMLALAAIRAAVDTILDLQAGDRIDVTDFFKGVRGPVARQSSSSRSTVRQRRLRSAVHGQLVDVVSFKGELGLTASEFASEYFLAG